MIFVPLINKKLSEDFKAFWYNITLNRLPQDKKIQKFHTKIPLCTVAHTEHDALVKSTTKIFSNFLAFLEKPKLYMELSH